MVDILKSNFGFSAWELNMGNGSSFTSAIGKVNMMPSIDMIFMRYRLMNICIAITKNLQKYSLPIQI